MKRFSTVRHSSMGGPVLTSLLFILMLGLLVRGLGSVSTSSDAEQLRTVEQSIVHAAVHCYAIEGVYPPGLSYLEKRYGLVIDHKKYLVDYRCFASNLMPDVTVIRK
ncbi:MAG: hypothetical protein RR135_00330 [Oscillospiraceae bacterium]